jgi:hypothetical protein
MTHLLHTHTLMCLHVTIVSLLGISKYSIALPRPGWISVQCSCCCLAVHLLGCLSHAPPRVSISCTSSGVYLMHPLRVALSHAPPAGCSISAPPRVSISCTSSGCSISAPPRVSISCTSSGVYLMHLLGLLYLGTSSGVYLVHLLGLLYLGSSPLSAPP